MKKYSKEQLERELEDFLSLGAKHIIKQKYSEIFFSRPMSLKKLKEFIESKLSLKVSEKELQVWKQEYEANRLNNQNQNTDNQNNDTQKQQMLKGNNSTNQEEHETNLSNNQNQNIDNQNSNTQKQQILINDDSTNQEEVDSWQS